MLKMAIKTANELVKKLKEIAENYKTLYVLGCIGAPMTNSNKDRYSSNLEYNREPTRSVKIKSATESTFGFDCVCLIKAVLWGWNGDKTKSYGGAAYQSNGVPDINADAMIKVCQDVSTDFSNIQVGEAVWMKGHIGVYIGDGLAVECTPKWKDGVQITAVHNIDKKTGYNGRKWTKHGKLPYVSYTAEKAETAEKKEDNTSAVKVEKKATVTAQSFLKSVAGTYKVTASALNVRNGAGINKKVLVKIPKDTVVQCYGYYTSYMGVKWLLIQFTYKGVLYTGFASSKYLIK